MDTEDDALYWNCAFVGSNMSFLSFRDSSQVVQNLATFQFNGAKSVSETSGVLLNSAAVFAPPIHLGAGNMLHASLPFPVLRIPVGSAWCPAPQIL
ncbi:hypothetical protein [Noviherbaspirillum pedocola]|uniref:Uncharacterized protein n=1 Tax=Noviherbaspirillum pedocola TaxID=2801341 RepID=A0A934T171_9BURK|nr:hypothetical protein [Noviherbaspirillum pedocola]MBK4737012.1 hypothetical protein [Noviherbaspirillum pedocola]